MVDERVQAAIDELLEAHAASMKAHSHFKKCQAEVFFKLDPATPLEDFEKVVDAKFSKFMQKPRTKNPRNKDFEAAQIQKRYHVPSWTLNESLDKENAKTFDVKTFKRRKYQD